MRQKATSWGDVAGWYDEYLLDDDTYQAQVVWPNLKRLLQNSHASIMAKNGSRTPRLIDIACGQGYFSFLCAEEGFRVTGVDIAPQLIDVALERRAGMRQVPEDALPNFQIAPAHDMKHIADDTFDCAICVLALQNIRELDQAIAECKRVLVKGGSFIFILNHPSFRIPQYSDWNYDASKNRQGRVVTKYMQEATITIDMNPGNASAKQKRYTYSFHRPLQLFSKLLQKHGFAIMRIEEWCSHKKTEAGPRKEAENEARKEIPMFMCIEAKIINS